MDGWIPLREGRVSYFTQASIQVTKRHDEELNRLDVRTYDRLFPCWWGLWWNKRSSIYLIVRDEFKLSVSGDRHSWVGSKPTAF